MDSNLVFIPFLTRSRFAQTVGISEDVLERWIRDGRVVTFKMGKRSLIDMRQWLSNKDKNEEKKG
jgi:predicted site-specific integrase-resolvase